MDSAFAQAVNTAAGFGGSAPTGEKETFAPGEWMPGASGDGGASPTVKTPQEQRGARKPNATPTPGQDFEPSSWSPGGQTKESGRGGGGGDFTPGEWKPGG